MSTTTVSTVAALTNALKAAHSGDTIQLSSGSYSGLNLSNMSFANDVTITSADMAHEAVLTDFSLTGVSGVTFTNLEMVATGKAGYGFNVNKSNDIHFDHVYVHGSLDNDATNDISGIAFNQTSNLSVTNSTLEQLSQGVGVKTGSNIVLSGNVIHDVRMTGLVFAQVDHVAVTGNAISNLRPTATTHPDAIQFFTTGTTVASHDIDISNNVIVKGDGEGTQGIFLRDQLGTLPFQHVTIDNNLIVGTGYGGVYVMGANGLELSGNQLISNDGKTNNTFFLIQGADHVTATNNQAQTISFDQVTNLAQSGNVRNQAVTDGGKATVAQWSLAHKGGALALLDPKTPFQPVIQDAAAGGGAGAMNAPFAMAQDGPAVMLDDATHDLALSQTSRAIADGVGNALNNLMTGNAWDNTLMGLDGDDTLAGSAGNDTLVGGAGNDTYLAPSATSLIVENPGEGIDTVIAKGTFVLPDNVENLVLDNVTPKDWNGTGNGLNNQITGNSGVNRLDGGAGNDTIDGGSGKDDITGGAGNDRLIGGAGIDTFRFAPGSGHDVIVDFGAGGEKDLIDISAFTKAGISSSIVTVGHDLMVNFSNGESISLLGVDAVDMKPWFAGWVF